MTDVQLPLRVRLLGPLLRKTRPAALATRLKQLLNIKRTVVRTARGEFLVDPVSHLGNLLIREGEYEPEMTTTLQRYLPHGGVFADVGANEGYFSVLAGQIVGPTGRVIAVEPQGRLRPVIEENIRLNGLQNVALYETAVSDSEGVADLYLAPDLNTGSSGLARQNRYTVPTQSVRMTRLANVLSTAGVDKIDLMKMDIEGFEYEAIMGSKELFQDGRVRAFALELHPAVILGRGHDPETLVAFLRDRGYREDRSTGNAVFIWARA
jgi:FkbM family methyltransferase